MFIQINLELKENQNEIKEKNTEDNKKNWIKSSKNLNIWLVSYVLSFLVIIKGLCL